MARQFDSTVALRVLFFFARHPDELLTTTDVAERWKVDAQRVHRILGRAVSTGLLARACTGPGRGRVCHYSAGDEMISMIGGPKYACYSAVDFVSACFPAALAETPAANMPLYAGVVTP